MITREQKVRVGVFFFIGTFLIAALFFISFGRTLFQEKKIYFIRFEDTSVNGLEVGGNVKYNGINIGEVKSIEVSSEDIGHVIVTVSVDKDTPIKEDMKANLVMMGITGLKQIELTGGTNRAKDLEPGGFIETGSSAIADITGEAQIIADKIELLLNNLNNFASPANQQAVSNILANTDYFIEQNRDKLSNVIAHTEVISSDLRSAAAVLRGKIEGEQIDTILTNALEVTESAQQMVDNLRAVMRPERIDQITANLAEFTEMMKGEATQQMLAETGDILTEIKSILEQTDKTSQLIDMTVLKSSRDIVDAIKTLNEALKNLNEFSRIISEDPSRLIEF
jgi:phospholipid/cholesterol/gamma-HCH transport system substrate-binding protein